MKISSIKLNWHGLCLMVLLLFASGCATIINGTKQKVTVSSQPSDAVVNIGLQSGKTPCEFVLSRSRDHKVEISKPGYETRVVYIYREPNWWPLGNVIFIPGIIIDFSFGGGLTLMPKNPTIELDQHL